MENDAMTPNDEGSIPTRESANPRTLDFDNLVWWKVNGAKYPNLQQIVRDPFAIPMSTITFDSGFSGSGRLISPHCGSLNEDTIEALMYAQNWLWANSQNKDKLSYIFLFH